MFTENIKSCIVDECFSKDNVGLYKRFDKSELEGSFANLFFKTKLYQICQNRTITRHTLKPHGCYRICIVVIVKNLAS